MITARDITFTGKLTGKVDTSNIAPGPPNSVLCTDANGNVGWQIDNNEQIRLLKEANKKLADENALLETDNNNLFVENGNLRLDIADLTKQITDLKAKLSTIWSVVTKK